MYKRQLFALSIRAEHNPRKKPDVSAQFQTVSGHSISLNGIGLAYSYEYAFAPKGTIIFSAGSSYAFGRILQMCIRDRNRNPVLDGT